MPPQESIQIDPASMAHLKSVLDRMGSGALDALGKAAVDEMTKMMQVSKGQCPVDTGTLRASGMVQPPVRVGNQVVVTAGYGGAASGYAIYVHEDLNATHPVGNAKFLERPFLAALPQMPRNIATRIEAFLAGIR